MIKREFLLTYLFSLLLSLLCLTAVFGKRNSTEKAIYRDSSAPIERRVEDLLGRLTLQEKILQLGGNNNWNTPDNRRLGIAGFKMADGPAGVTIGRATCFPSPIALAATWDRDLNYRTAAALGAELRAKGRYVALGPTVNIVRDPRGGRSFESFGEDPYLSSQLGVAYVKGVQSKNVIATVKHFACNNQEDGRKTNNVLVNERTLREIYLPAFKACVQQGKCLSVMTAYNKVGHQYCSENWYLLNTILKDEWGFEGYVVSDWGACHSTVNSILAGLDVEKPKARYFGRPLREAVSRGKVQEKIIDRAVKRVLRAKFLAGVFDKRVKPTPKLVNTIEHQGLALEAARKSIVLLKNEGALLPLDRKKISSIYVGGSNANVAVIGGGGSSLVTPYYSVSALEGIRSAAGGDFQVLFSQARQRRASRGLSSQVRQAVSRADAVIVVVGTNSEIETEGRDRADLYLPRGQDEFVEEIVSINPNTIVVVVSGSAVLMNDWIDKVPAVIQCFFGGQEMGNAIADVLFGVQNPCGKLPITFPRWMKQLPPFTNLYEPPGEGPGYRFYDKYRQVPLFAFGHGLSYTTFDYKNLKIAPGNSTVEMDVTVTVDIHNSGKVAGSEVVQLYISDVRASVERPEKELKGFERVTLEGGETKTVTFTLDESAFAFYDIKAKMFVVEPGVFDILVGSSSSDIRIKGIVSKERGK
ncbi:MAG: glycosyl hydrolase [Planctomycetes bacterium]|nr:glycosyl hydrolase [Planctomycetota bacterium]